MSFAGIGFGIIDHPGGNDNCFPNGQPARGTPKPFTFGVPQIVHVEVEGSAFAGSFSFGAGGLESLDGIRFYDPAGNLLSNVNYTLVSVDLPEPSALSMLSIGMMFFVAVAIRGPRFRGGFHRETGDSPLRKDVTNFSSLRPISGPCRTRQSCIRRDPSVCE